MEAAPQSSRAVKSKPSLEAPPAKATPRHAACGCLRWRDAPMRMNSEKRNDKKKKLNCAYEAKPTSKTAPCFGLPPWLASSLHPVRPLGAASETFLTAAQAISLARLSRPSPPSRPAPRSAESIELPPRPSGTTQLARCVFRHSAPYMLADPQLDLPDSAAEHMLLDIDSPRSRPNISALFDTRVVVRLIVSLKVSGTKIIQFLIWLFILAPESPSVSASETAGARR